MNKNALLKIVNPIIALLALNQILSGVLRDELPRGVFGVLHIYGAGLFALAVVCHVVLNWPWIQATYLRRKQADAQRG